ASLVTHYALAHPDKHFELHSATNAILVAPPVADSGQRVYQVFGKEVLDQLIPVAALQPLERIGLPQPPPWRRAQEEENVGNPSASLSASSAGEDSVQEEEKDPGELRLHGFISKPEIQKLNRNSIYVFVNGRLVRDRLIQHALTEAYRNVIPPSVFPVVLLFLELPSGEVDVNVHPSKTEVRFRQQSLLHDFVRDSVRAALVKARPVPQFVTEMTARPTATPSLTPGSRSTVDIAAWRAAYAPAAPPGFALQAPVLPAITERLQFGGDGISVEANAAVALARAPDPVFPGNGCAPPIQEEPDAVSDLAPSISSLKCLGQIRESFILAVDQQGLWIIDQHVA